MEYKWSTQVCIKTALFQRILRTIILSPILVISASGLGGRFSVSSATKGGSETTSETGSEDDSSLTVVTGSDAATDGSTDGATDAVTDSVAVVLPHSPSSLSSSSSSSSSSSTFAAQRELTCYNKSAGYNKEYTGSSIKTVFHFQLDN